MARQARQTGKSAKPVPGVVQESAAKPGAPRPPAAAQGRAIVLFSDGTGNSSAKLFKTNVWRMYEAVDLGPAEPEKREQIAFYDDGVGTSAVRPMAMLGGIFGFGLKRNVLDIYRYACRNYRPGQGQEVGSNPKGLGDQLYGFGFSRGGFTMRVAMAMIATQGLVSSTDEADLNRRSLAAYRDFRKAFVPRKLAWPTRALRWVRDSFVSLNGRRKGLAPYKASDNHRPVIRFMGIWDTVAAYGGPVIELTRAIDNWIFPLSMPDYALADSVRCARHALALDDARDAFLPLLWDEIAEDEAIARARDTKTCPWIDKDRLQQVWFTGMHADVGGGYPDESLSYVSFLWIMEEAEKADLRVLKVITDRYRALANSSGPLHDSRIGLGSYYRYQPRNIAAWVEPPDRSTLTLQDPEIVHPNGTPRGLLRKVQVHESVIARIANGTDRYAPIALPARFDIVPPQREGENAPQADSETPVAAPTPDTPVPIVPDEIRRRLADPDVIARRREAARLVWHSVWKRRVTYFATVIVTLLLVFLPILRLWEQGKNSWFSPIDRICSDDRCIIPHIISALRIFVPEFLEGWVDVFAAHAGWFLALVGVILVLRWLGNRTESGIRNRSFHLWQASLGRGSWPTARRRSPLRWLHETGRYQAEFRDIKWYVLPSLFAIAIAAALLYLVSIVVTQAYLYVAEQRSTFCPVDLAPDAERLPPGTVDIRSRCTPLHAIVDEERNYRVTLELPLRPESGKPGEWSDGSFAATPAGIPGSEMGLVGRLGAPLRRVVCANYLQPILEIREPTRLGFSHIHVEALRFMPDPTSPGRYTATFRSPQRGRVYFFVNDVAPPFGLSRFFYENNRGTARVRIENWSGPVSENSEC